MNAPHFNPKAALVTGATCQGGAFLSDLLGLPVSAGLGYEQQDRVVAMLRQALIGSTVAMPSGPGA